MISPAGSPYSLTLLDLPSNGHWINSILRFSLTNNTAFLTALTFNKVTVIVSKQNDTTCRKERQHYFRNCHQDFLIEQLKDHDEAIADLNAALEESLKGDEESQHLFLIVLRNVVDVQGCVGVLAKKAQVGRESL